MNKVKLGNSGLEVTELCFGALPMGPLQAKIPTSEGAEVILAALEAGVNFIDTAEMYDTYSYIREALDRFDGEVIIASKSTAASYEGMEKAIEDALKSLGRNYIDIFHLHAARVGREVFEDRKEALRCLIDYKKKGIIKAIGISTHRIETVEAAAQVEEIDIIFPIINILGMGIIDGGPAEMIEAINKAALAGKGLYAMKALAGGHLIDRLPEAIEYVRSISGMSSVAVGMISTKELELNLKIFNGEEIPKEMLPEKSGANKKLFVARFCKGCGTCLEACPNGALTLDNGKAKVDPELCLLCGYCNPVCPEFALRLI